MFRVERSVSRGFCLRLSHRLTKVCFPLTHSHSIHTTRLDHPPNPPHAHKSTHPLPLPLPIPRRGKAPKHQTIRGPWGCQTRHPRPQRARRNPQRRRAIGNTFTGSSSFPCVRALAFKRSQHDSTCFAAVRKNRSVRCQLRDSFPLGAHGNLVVHQNSVLFRFGPVCQGQVLHGRGNNLRRPRVPNCVPKALESLTLPPSTRPIKPMPCFILQSNLGRMHKEHKCTMWVVVTTAESGIVHVVSTIWMTDSRCASESNARSKHTALLNVERALA